MQIGAHQFASLPSPANESPRWPERLPLFWSAVIVLLLTAWGWTCLAFAFAALADFGSAAMNFVSTNISISSR